MINLLIFNCICCYYLCVCVCVCAGAGTCCGTPVKLEDTLWELVLSFHWNSGVELQPGK